MFIGHEPGFQVQYYNHHGSLFPIELLQCKEKMLHNGIHTYTHKHTMAFTANTLEAYSRFTGWIILMNSDKLSSDT